MLIYISALPKILQYIYISILFFAIAMVGMCSINYDQVTLHINYLGPQEA